MIFNEASFAGTGEFNADYLDKRCTSAVNGIFVILVVFSHYAQYAGFEGVYDDPYLSLRSHLGQMVVTTFLFYSGYGMMEAIKRTKGAYVKKLPSKFWQLLLRVDVAVFLFLLMNTCLGISFPVKQILLSFLTWESIGNSNWYILIILIEYLLMYAAFGAGRVTSETGRKAGLVIMAAFTLALIFVLRKAGKPDYFYNTVIVLVFGAFWSEYKTVIEKTVQRSDLTYLISLAAVIGVYLLSFFKKAEYGLPVYSLWALAFTSLVILITMKMRIRNKVLEWFGKHIFSIYILQRIPMIILQRAGCIESHRYMSLVVVFAVTMPLALIFEKTTDAIIGFIKGEKRGNL